MLHIKQQIAKLVDECMQHHIETFQHNNVALILQEMQNKEQKDQICSMKIKINNLEKKEHRRNNNLSMYIILVRRLFSQLPTVSIQ